MVLGAAVVKGALGPEASAEPGAPGTQGSSSVGGISGFSSFSCFGCGRDSGAF